MPISIKEVLENAALDAESLYALHQKYIEDSWGVHHMEGKRFHLTPVTYRKEGEREYKEAQEALTRLQDAMNYPVPFLPRNHLDSFISAMEGISIRLAQRFSELSRESGRQKDKRLFDFCWGNLKQYYKKLDRFAQ